jgi:hypothetical protein
MGSNVKPGAGRSRDVNGRARSRLLKSKPTSKLHVLGATLVQKPRFVGANSVYDDWVSCVLIDLKCRKRTYAAVWNHLERERGAHKAMRSKERIWILRGACMPGSDRRVPIDSYCVRKAIVRYD